MMNIIKNGINVEINPRPEFSGHHKQGELTNIKRSAINRILGFAGQYHLLGRCNNKPSRYWTFTIKEQDGTVHQCAIWDYYATGTHYSVYMPQHLAVALFEGNYVPYAI